MKSRKDKTQEIRNFAEQATWLEPSVSIGSIVKVIPSMSSPFMLLM